MDLSQSLSTYYCRLILYSTIELLRCQDAHKLRASQYKVRIEHQKYIYNSQRTDFEIN